MTTTSEFLGKPQPPRDGKGRYLVRSLDGSKLVPYTRATTIAETNSDRWNLELWAKRHVVSGLTIDRALVAEATGLEVKADRDKLNSIAERAMTASRAHERADAGTRMHLLAELSDAGQPLPADVTDIERADIDAYTRALREAGCELVPEMSEVVVIHDDLKIAGTLDRIIRRRDGRLQVLDLKTGDSVEYAIREIAVQMAIYAYATNIYRWEDETRLPMPGDLDTMGGLIAWCPLGRGKCELIAVDLMAGWRGVELALQVRKWRSQKMAQLAQTLYAAEVQEVQEVEPVEIDTGLLAHLRRRAARLKMKYPEAANELVGRWPLGVPSLKSEGPFTAEQLEELLKAMQRVEASHSVPFGETWPPPPLRPVSSRPTMTEEQTAKAISALVD